MSLFKQAMSDLSSAFEQWVWGINGDGNVYLSREISYAVGDTTYNLTAYQRRKCWFTGNVKKVSLGRTNYGT